MPVVKISRKSGAAPRGIDLARSAFTGISKALADPERSDRLARHFTKLKQRLDQVLAAVKIDPDPVALATRHFLCAEALVEVLERHTRRSSGCNRMSARQLMTAYSRGVADKLLHFHERPANEQRRILTHYPEVNLCYVLRGCEKGLIRWESAAGVLEESHEYDILIKRLNQANLLMD